MPQFAYKYIEMRQIVYTCPK